MDLNLVMSATISGLSIPIQRQRSLCWMKNKAQIYAACKNLLKMYTHTLVNSNRRKKIYYTKEKEDEIISVLLSEKGKEC